MKYINKIFINRNYLIISTIFGLLLLMMFILQKINAAYILLFTYWLYTTLFAIIKIKSRVFLLILNLTLFTFTLSRPVINILKGTKWYFSYSVLTKAGYIIFFSDFCLFLGNIIFEKFNTSNNKKSNNKVSSKTLKVLFLIVNIMFIFNFFTQIYTYFQLHNLDYATIYTANTPSFNIIIRTLSALFPYAVFAYLSLIPNKKTSIWCLSIYLVSSVPLLLLGSRSDFVLRILFIIVYYVIRQYIEKKEKWITKRKIIICVLLIPIGISFLGAYNYIRDNKKMESYSMIGLSLDFFHKQGTTFDTICQGIQHENELKNKFNVKSYVFGEFIDYILHNTITIKVFHTKELASGNSLDMIKYGNSLAHNISYVVLGEKSYLKGHGRGTSYLIETYIDFNIVGVIIYSLLIGIYLSSIMCLIKKNNTIITLIVLTTLSQIYLIPRYSSFGFLAFIIKPQFWIIVVLMFVISRAFGEKKRERSVKND